ncbi:MAG: cohesin domain-containing protein [Armatimonadota bacterium]
MNKATRLSIFLVSLALIVVCVGCGGGGGGTGTVTPVQTLGLDVTEPTLSGRTGQTISVPVVVSGSGTAQNASFNLHFNSGVFEPVSGATVGGNSVAIAGTASGVVARYKWIDAQTVKVLYASSSGAASGSALVSVPLKVKAETATALAVQSVLLNK